MDIYNGNRDIGIKERPVKAAPEPSPAQEPGPEPEQAATPEPPAPPPQGDLFAPPSEPAPAPEPAPTAEPLLFEPTPEPARLSRYAAPISQSQMRDPMMNFMSPTIWRVAALACAAIVLVWLGFLGMRALYRATSAPDGNEAKVQQEAEAKAKPSAAPRTPQAIPALYID